MTLIIIAFLFIFCSVRVIEKINNYYFKKYKNLKFKKKKKYNDKMNEKICTICIEEFKEKENIFQLKCNHIYHINCIDDWIDTKGESEVKCPNCNENIFDNIKEPLLSII